MTIVRRPQARGLRLSVDPRDGVVRLMLGPRAALRPALAWAAGKRDWVEAELARLPRAEPIMPGGSFMLGDARVEILWDEHAPRRPVLCATTLRLGGPRDTLTARVLRFLRAHALAVLTIETRALAAEHGIIIARVGVGDPRARWGSCSTAGDIRYSWRLILAPDFVRRATVAHEVAHRLHMNHGAQFHAAAARLNAGDPTPARLWLRAHGPALHWFGRDCG